MGRDAYRPSVVTSTRTFQTTPVSPELPVAKPKKTLPKLPAMNVPKVGFGLRRLPWIIAAVFGLLSLFLFVQYRDAKHKLQSPSASVTATKQVNSVIANVRKLVVVPGSESPTVATVSDAEKLKSQSFFANAHDGDKVLVYSREKEAILYRPSTNQIVTMAPIASGQQSQ